MKANIDALLQKAKAEFDALSPVDKVILQCVQKLSFIYGQQPSYNTRTKAEIRAAMPEFVLIDEIARLRKELKRTAITEGGDLP